MSIRLGECDGLNTPEGFFETSVWIEEQRSIARHLSDDGWEAIAVLFENVAVARTLEP
jgi:hypothetical protein